MNPWNLTPAECASMAAFIEYGSTGAAAKAMGLSGRTVESQVQIARQKMGAPKPVTAAVWWDRFVRETGWVSSANVKRPTAGASGRVGAYLNRNSGVSRAEAAREVGITLVQASNALAHLRNLNEAHCVGKRWYPGAAPRKEVAAASVRRASSVWEMGSAA